MSDPRTDIFVYHDGTRERRADPFVLHRALYHYAAQSGSDFAQLCRDSASDDYAVSFEPWRKLLGITALAFDLPLWSEETLDGLTADKVDAVLNAFLDFAAAQKKSAAFSPTSPAPTA